MARAWGLSVSQLTEPVRRPRQVLARQSVVYLARNLLGLSYPEAAELVGYTNHTTAISGFRQVRDRLPRDSDLARRLNWAQKVLHDNFDLALPPG